jgi:3-phosphoglycerate kinase
MKLINEIDVKGKRVLVRVDFNVPLDEKGNVTDDNRIRASLPTIRYAIDKGGKLILMSHLGRPKGKDPKLSLKPVSIRLSELLGRKVFMLDDCIGEKVENFVKGMKAGDVALLENLRFYPDEEKDNPEFAGKLARLADVYVNDAFGCAHRAHASVSAITGHIKGVGGFLLKKEVDYLGKLLSKPERPFVCILGGAKVSDKIPVIENLLDKVDTFLIGGGMAYTFLKAQGKTVGLSKLEEDKLTFVNNLLASAGSKIVLPVDHIVADKPSLDANVKSAGADIPAGWIGLDIGEKTITLFTDKLKSAKTVFWNGPLGMFELEKFSKGTKAIAQFLARCKALTVAGGGDTVSALEQFGVKNKLTHVSSGGGASLEFLSGLTLPGIAALG